MKDDERELTREEIRLAVKEQRKAARPTGGSAERARPAVARKTTKEDTAMVSIRVPLSWLAMADAAGARAAVPAPPFEMVPRSRVLRLALWLGLKELVDEEH